MQGLHSKVFMCGELALPGGRKLIPPPFPAALHRFDIRVQDANGLSSCFFRFNAVGANETNLLTAQKS
jgi:hypothetical protein